MLDQPSRVIVLAALAVAGQAAWTAVYTVPSDSIAVVQHFGRYLKDAPQGLQFKLPLGIDTATIVPVKRQLRQEFGFTTPGARDPYQGSLCLRIRHVGSRGRSDRRRDDHHRQPGNRDRSAHQGADALDQVRNGDQHRPGAMEDEPSEIS